MTKSHPRNPFANFARAARAASSLARAAGALAQGRVTAVLRPYPAADRLAAGLRAALALGPASYRAAPGEAVRSAERVVVPAPLEAYPRALLPRDFRGFDRAAAALSRTRGAAPRRAPDQERPRGARGASADFSTIAAALHGAVVERMSRAGRAMQIPARAIAGVSNSQAAGTDPVRERRGANLGAALSSLDRIRAPLKAAAQAARAGARRARGATETVERTNRSDESSARGFEAALRAIAAGRGLRRALAGAPGDAMMRAVKFAEPRPIVARDFAPRGAGARAGAAAVTINSSPTITVHVPAGGGGLGTGEIERAVGDALEGHAQRIYEIVERVGAMRARTEF